MKKITLWLLVLALTILGIAALSGCQFIQRGDDDTQCVLDTESFNSTVVYGENVNLEGLKIIKTKDGEVTEIPVDSSMISSPADTTVVGATSMKITFEGREYAVPLSVKYRVILKADGKIFDTLYVMTNAELSDISAPEKAGYVFSGWNPEIPDTLTGNITLEAVYSEAIPKLTELQATYGDKLGDITLPSNASGKWVFKTPDSTVGNAGKNEAAVSFVINSTGEVLKNDVVKINVAKRTVNFTNVKTDFVYNGKKQIPTYVTDADVDVIFYEEAGANYTDAGTYSYYFEVDDPNHVGVLEGSYEIAKAEVTVKISSYTVFSNESLPRIAYEIQGFADHSILGLTVTNPEDVVNGAGIYTLTATSSNPSVNLTVESGTLTVISTILDVGAPQLNTTIATYGDSISVLTFKSHPQGRWTWKTPDAKVGDVGTSTHVAEFIPNDNRYETLTYNVNITVKAKVLTITIVGDTFEYDGSYHTLQYKITDADGNEYDLEVTGNDPRKDAGYTDLTLKLANTNYEAETTARITVTKRNPDINFTTEIKAVWSSTLKLSYLELPEGCAWEEPDTKIESAGEGTYTAIYTPEDTNNYNTVEVTFTVIAEKANATISNVNNSYEFTYTGSEIVLSGIFTTPENVELEFEYTLNGAPAAAIKNVGTYAVTITLPETKNYKSATATTTVTVSAANNTDVFPAYTAKYGDKLSTLELPSSDNGTWSWKNANADTTVGNAGENKFTAVFTPATENYNAREVEITVTVAKKKIDAPSIAEEMRRQAYTGDRIYSGLINSEGYTVTDDGGISKGTYTATLVLDTTNYVWSDGSSESKTLTYEIVEATNEWTSKPTINPSWKYGETAALDKNSDEYKAYLGSATAKYGTVTITYALAGTNSFSAELPTDAGKYIARFTAIHTDAATKSEDVPFEILKMTVDIPSYTDSYVYTGTGVNAGISATENYDVADELRTDAGSYNAKLTLRYPSNYVWADGDTNAYKNLPYTISKANAVIEDFTIGNVKFGEALAPTATVSLGAKYKFLYSTAADGEYTDTAPTAVGTYFVKVSVTGNENVNASESAPIEFAINKADVTISGYQTSYEKTYDTNVFAITGVTASNGAEVKFSVKKNGADAEIKNAGVYSVTIYTEENESYNASSVTVTVTVIAADNEDTVKSIQNATYGDKLSTLELPSSDNGTWSWKNANADTTVGNAGENKFTAVFTPATENYNAREVEVTVTVQKATVGVPNPSHSVYDGELHNSGITENEFYTVVDEGGYDKGTYTVTLTLKNSANYKWVNSADATIYVEYSISEAVNGWTTEPSVKTPVEYGDTDSLASAEANYGGVLIEYKEENEDDEKYTTIAPTLPGKYLVRFTTTDENYTKRTVIKSLEITKKKIPAPTVTVTKFVYTGEKITLGLAVSDYYTVSDEGSTNTASSIVATITLNSKYYVWADGTEGLTKEYTYSVIPATNSVSTPIVDGWTYGEEANAPTGSSDSFGCGIYYVYSSAANGEYTAAFPTNAGTYYVKAIAKATANVNAAESSPVAFTIAKAQASIEGYKEKYTQTYNGTNFTFDDKGIAASYDDATLEYAITKDGENVSAIKNAGVYTVKVTLPESANYLGDEVEFTVTVNKVVNTDTIPTYTATYGDKLSTLAVPSSVTGDWKWKDITDTTTVGDAGNREHTLVFTPDDEANYESREVTVTVTVAKATIFTPAAKNPTNVYANVTHTSGLTSTDFYTVEDAGGVNVGTYSATLTLTDSSNYAWDDPSNESATTTVTYTVTEGTNEITSAAIDNWTYGEAGNAGSATAKYDGIVITYKAEDEGDDKYSPTLPTNAGNYVARFTTTDANCPAVSVTRTFTIEPATVDAPTASDVYYNGEVQTGGISNDEFYTVIGEGGVNVGDYSITVTLTDKNNYKWNTTGNSSDITLNYKILKTTVTLSGLSAGWTYDSPQEPTVTVSHEFAKQYVTFLYSADGGSTWSTEKPTAAGTYKVKATIAETSNYTADDREADFTVDRAEPTFAAPYFANGTHYQNLLNLSTSGFKAYNNGKEISGSFSFGDVVFADGAGASSVTLTFTPEDTTNYKTVTETYNMTLVSVAYLNNTVAYGTIEDAIIAANAAEGGTVWVRPDTSGNVIIKNDITIYENVTLAIAFGTDDSGRNIPANDGKIYATLSDDGDGNSNTDYINGISLLERKTCVTLAAGTVITNYGTIEVSGELGAPGGGVRWTCHTVRYYAELLMEDGSQIISKNNSSIICCGFITETSTDKGSTITLESGASMCQPFTMHDYRGGSYMAAVYKVMSQGYSAFNMFEFRNVSAKLIINYGSAFKALINLYATNLLGVATMNAETVTMIGSDSNAVIQLNSVNSYLVAKRNPETKICDINIYGGAQTNGLVIAVDSSTKIDTSTSYFPVPYYFNITLNDNGNNAQYHLNQNFKFLTGSKLVVGEGVTLYAKKLMFYETFDDPCTIPGTYPTGLAPAEFILKGSAIIAEFGGIITAGSDSASLKITTGYTITTREVIKVSGKSIAAKIPSDGYKEIMFTAKLKNSSDSTITDLSLGLGLGRYFVEDGQWNPTTITFDSDGGSTVSSIHITGDTYPTLPTPAKQDYLFLGWFCDGTLVQSGEALLSMKSHTLTASWRRLTAITLTPDMDGFEAETVYSDPVESSVYPTLPNLEKVGYTFVGWFYGETQVQSGEAIKTTDDHTLTAQWRRNVFVTLDSTFDDVADTTVYVDSVASGIYPTLPTPEKVGYTFLGWFYGETQVQSGEALKTTDDHVLTAKWSRQIVVNLDSGVDDIADSVIYVNSGEGAVYPELPTLEKSGNAFIGWFYGEEQVSAGDAVKTAEDHVLVAKWKTVTVITFDPNGGSLENTYVNVDLDTETVYPTLPTPTAKDGQSFAGWYYGDTKVESGNVFAFNGEHTLVAKYNYQIVEGTIDGVTMTLSVNGQTINLNDYVPAGATVTITITFNKSTNSLYVRDESGNNLSIFKSDGTELGTSVSNGTYTFTMPASKVKIQATSSGGGCVTGDTLVTLADGTQKRVDALDGTEVLLVWDFYEGKYTISPVGAIVNHGYDIANEVTMKFSDGTSIKALRGHGFFDITENKFVIIDEFNINDYIGHAFARYDDEGNCETTILVDYSVKSTYNEIWTIVSAVHFNCVLNGLLTLSPTDFPDSPSYLMPFEIGEDMKYDEAAMQADIEAYGQYTYQEFSEYCTYEQFVGLNFANWKVAVGKGYITFDEIVYLIETYLNN